MARARTGMFMAAAVMLAACHQAAPAGHRTALAARASTSPPGPEVAYDVPWVDRPAPRLIFPPPVTAPPPPTGARPCQAADLAIAPDFGNGAGGHLEFVFSFTNRSKTTCSLVGYPTVLATAPHQAPVQATNGTFFPDQNGGGNVQAGEAATVVVETDEECPARYVPGATAPERFYDSVTFRLRGGDRTLRAHLDVLCGLKTGRFNVPQAQPVYPPDPLAGLTTTLSLPPSAPSGETLSYVVTLSNPTDIAITLDPCPGYIEWLADSPQLVKETFALNCDSVHTIDPHATVRYAMRLHLPPATPPGAVRIFWDLDRPGMPSSGSLVLR